MKNLISLTIILIFIQTVYSQERLAVTRLYIDRKHAFLHTNFDCKDTLIICDNLNIAIDQICYHPNGDLIGIWQQCLGPVSNCPKDSIVLFKIDPLNCEVKIIRSFSQDNFSLYPRLFYIDYLGRIISRGGIGMHEKLLLAESLRDTFKTISILPNKGIYFDDFTYIKGLLFAYDNFSGEIDQFDQNFKFIKSYNYLSHSLGSFTNIYYDCDSFNTFCFGSKKDIKTLNDKPWDLGIYQFRFDLENGILLDSMCYTPAFDTNVVGWAGNLTSKYEYLGSDPECDLLLDLDRNNSSGLYPYDFDIPFALCAPYDSATLCDDDLYLHTSFPLDSISILLSNALNLPLEFIASTGLPPGFSLLRRSDSTWTLSGSSASDAEYTLALKSLRYINNAPFRISGSRQISFQGHNSLKSGSLARAFLRLGNKPYSGPDTSIHICLPALDPVDLLPLLSNADSDGLFYPPLKSTNKVFVPGSDSYGLDRYITTDLFCGADTAQILLSEALSIPADLGPDLEFCNGDSFSLLLNHPALDSLWINGSPASPHIILRNPGSYFLTLKSKDGCLSYDTLLIQKSSRLLSRVDSLTVCRNGSLVYKNKTYFPGQTILDTLHAALSCDTLLSISLIPSDLNFTKVTRPLCLNEKYIYKNISYPPGSLIKDTLYAASGCDTLLELWLQPLPLPAVSILGDTLLCEGDTALLSTSASGSLLWSTGDTTRAISAAPGNYSLTVTDANNCSASSSFRVGQAPPLSYVITSYDPLCSEELGSVLLRVSSGGIPPIQYALNGMTNLSGIFSSLPPGSYIATFSDALGCTRSDTVLILPPPLFEVDMTDSITLDAGSSVLVQYRLRQGSIQNILFRPGEGIALDQGGLRISATTDQIYTLTFIDDNGCEITKTLKVSVRQNNEFFAPLIFSPNNDGINDFWLPSWGSSWTRAEIKIYDRWGALMASPPPAQGWDGNHHGMPCIPGVYLFHIVLYDAQGISTSFSGDLTLVR